jgi:transaldolase
MTMTQDLHKLGQSLWLDNITRGILDDGTLKRYIDELSVTGLTSNPTIFDEAIGGSALYDKSIQQKARNGLSGETLFVELALEDLRRAADLFRPEFDRTRGTDGWVSMEVSPLIAEDTRATIEAARSRVPGRASPRSRKPSLRACRSTSRCCSPGNTIWPSRRPTCGASSGASQPSSIRR